MLWDRRKTGMHLHELPLVHLLIQRARRQQPIHRAGPRLTIAPYARHGLNMQTHNHYGGVHARSE